MYRRAVHGLLVFGIGLFCLLGFKNAPAQTRSKIFDGSILRVNKLQSLLPNPAADLDQCANGGVGSPPVTCSGAAWQNGNLNHTQAHYREGESVPYRLKFSNLSAGSSYTVTIEYDTTEQSGAKHAIDYLTSFDRTETTADPCSDVPGCSLAVNSTFAIPPDANVGAGFDGIPGNSDDITQVPGVFTLFSGSITAVSAYTLNGTYAGASQTRITITFTADSDNPVLAWSGHISTRSDWGTNRSAIAINGSPYHMRLIDLNGMGGNQDRSLTVEAVVFPASITIIKDARPNTSQIFGFTATGPDVFNFSLIDDGNPTGNTQNFTNLTSFGGGNSVTITEDAPVGGYNLMQINCVENAQGGGGLQNTSVNVPLRRAHIILEEGESVTCTFINAVPTAATAVISGRILDIYGQFVKDVTVSVMNTTTGTVRSSRTNPFGYYSVAELPAGGSYIITVRAKHYTFATDTIAVMLVDDLSGQDFTAIPLE